MVFCIVLFLVAAACAASADRVERGLVLQGGAILKELQKTMKIIAKALERRECKITQSTDQGVTYTIWGRTSCYGPGTETLYSGYAGGSHYQHTGAAVDTLCLPKNPDWGVYTNGVHSHGAFLYGSVYKPKTNKLISKSNFGYLVPCAVCATNGRTRMAMIPAKNQCSKGWTKEYSGYLMAGDYAFQSATQYMCVDQNAEKLASKGNFRKVFFTAEARCNPLPCPPYVDGRELTCVVCTK